MPEKNSMRMFETRITFGALKCELPPEIEMLQEDIDDDVPPTSPELFQRIESVMKKYPDNPYMAHWKLACYEQLQCSEKALDQIIIDSYHKFPDHLLTQCYYGHMCMKNNEYEKIPHIFKNQFFIQDFYPKKKSFHVTDCFAFASVMVRYFCHTKNFVMARNYLILMTELEENEEITDPLFCEFLATFPEEAEAFLDHQPEQDITPAVPAEPRKPRTQKISARTSKQPKRKQRELL